MKLSYEITHGAGQILVETTPHNISNDHRLWMEIVLGTRKSERLLVPLTVGEARDLAAELNRVADIADPNEWDEVLR